MGKNIKEPMPMRNCFLCGQKTESNKKYEKERAKAEAARKNLNLYLTCEKCHKDTEGFVGPGTIQEIHEYMGKKRELGPGA